MPSDPITTTAIILAAGGSTRMGSPKALLDWCGEPLISAHIEALSARCDHIVVVLGSNADAIAAVLPPSVTVRVNSHWASTEPKDSLRIRLTNVRGPVLVTPVDVPPAPERVLDILLDTGAPAVPTHADKDGHPVLIDAEHTADTLQHKRLDQVLDGATRVSVEWAATLLNINTPEQWASYSSSLPGPRS